MVKVERKRESYTVQQHITTKSFS